MSKPVPMPLVLALAGLPGAGKTALAQALAPRFGLSLVSRDGVRAAMFPGGGAQDIEKRAAYRTVLLATEVNCALGRSTLIDGMTFGRRDDWQRLVATLASHRVRLLALHLDCPVAVAQARIAAQRACGGHPAPDRDEALVAQVALRFEPPPGAVRIDADQPPGVVRDNAIARLQVLLAAPD